MCSRTRKGDKDVDECKIDNAVYPSVSSFEPGDPIVWSYRHRIAFSF